MERDGVLGYYALLRGRQVRGLATAKHGGHGGFCDAFFPGMKDFFLFGTGDCDGRHHTTFASPTSVSHLMNYAEGSGWESRLACGLEKSLDSTQTRNRPLLIRLGIGTRKGILQQPLSTKLASTLHGRKRPARKTSLRHGNHTSERRTLSFVETIPTRHSFTTHFASRGRRCHITARPPFGSLSLTGRAEQPATSPFNTKGRDLTRRWLWLPTLFNSTTHVAGPPPTGG